MCVCVFLQRGSGRRETGLPDPRPEKCSDFVPVLCVVTKMLATCPSGLVDRLFSCYHVTGYKERAQRCSGRDIVSWTRLHFVALYSSRDCHPQGNLQCPKNPGRRSQGVVQALFGGVQEGTVYVIWRCFSGKDTVHKEHDPFWCQILTTLTSPFERFSESEKGKMLQNSGHFLHFRFFGILNTMFLATY